MRFRIRPRTIVAPDVASAEFFYQVINHL